MTHEKPNLGQIPAHDVVLGPLCRACFTVPEGKVLIGTDGKSLEERMLAHYINEPDYTEKALKDGHSYRRDLLGLVGKEGRDITKTWFYALLYGGGDLKLGQILLGKSLPDKVLRKAGADSRLKLVDGIPGLKKLLALIQQYFEQKKALTLVDGRWITLRSSHSALNALLQGSGAVVMKVALVLANRELKQKIPGDYAFVLNVHDEFQTEVTASKAEVAKEALLSSFIRAGELLRLNCPIEGDAKVGQNWSETH
jgi:DNA polymerase I-like protein with 3'-5' exonuclease and polymerase domains